MLGVLLQSANSDPLFTCSAQLRRFCDNEARSEEVTDWADFRNAVGNLSIRLGTRHLSVLEFRQNRFSLVTSVISKCTATKLYTLEHHSCSENNFYEMSNNILV